MKLTDNYGFYVPSVEDEENVVATLAGNFQAIDSILTAHNIFLEETTQEQMREIERISVNNTDLINDFKEEINRITKETKDTAAAARRISETVQSQFHQIIQEVGTNNPEIVQARGGKANLNERLNEFSEQLADNSRQTTTLSQGTSVVTGGKSTSLVDVEVEGRTLVSLGNSVLEPGKKYVVADRKTRVIVDGQTVNGVGRFTKIGNAERVKIVRVANFEGKVAGSTVENPHIAKWSGNNTLQIPSHSSWVENIQSRIDGIVSLGNGVHVSSSNTPGGYSQQLFSFNLIEEIERNIGKIPRGTVAEKVAWVKANLNSVNFNWHGFGSSVGGNKATTARWSNTSNSWTQYSTVSHSHSVVSKLTINNVTTLNAIIGTDGFIHFLAYAEPSDGTTPSVINTDYVELEIELKETADFTNPRVPLYEVTDAEYLKILTEWNGDEVARRFPMVQGVQHLQGVGIVAEGENLLPPFTDSSWVIHPTSKINSSYELEQNPTATSQLNTIEINVSQNQAYNFSCIRKNADSLVKVTYLDDKKTNIGAVWLPFSSNSTFTTPTGTKILRVDIYPNVTNQVGWSNLMLTIGTTPKPFVPRNPSSLYADVKLGAIGGKFDRLYASNGRWFVRKEVEKDVVLDGSLEWTYSSIGNGLKRVFINLGVIGDSLIATNPKGIQLSGRLTGDTNYIDGEKYIIHSGTNPRRFYLGLLNIDTGFGESQVIGTNDIKRYFNGWKYTDGTTWTSVTGNGQTATGQQALDTKPSDYTPYKLGYVLATPQTIDVTDKVEAAIKLNGLTQISVDAGFRRNFKDGKSDWKKGSTMDYTTNPVNVKMTYANNVRNALDETTTRLQDNTVKLDQHERAIVDLYAQLKAMGAK